MVMFGRGLISESEPDSIIALFFDRAPAYLRGYAIEFMGRSLEPRAKIDEGFRKRLMDFWSWRVAMMKQSANLDMHAEELAAFGHWFVSGYFNDQWALERLIEAKRLGGTKSPDAFILVWLIETAKENPGLSLECLELMLDAKKDPEFVRWHREEFYSLMKSLIGHTDPAISKRALEFLNELGRRGHFEFRDLVKPA